MDITDSQAIFAAPMLTEGLLFVGEFRGFSQRNIGYNVKDRDGKITGKDEMDIQQFLVEIQPREGMPVPMLCEMAASKGRGEVLAPVTAQKGATVLVVVREMEFNKYQKKIIVKASAVHELKDGQPPAKVVTLKPGRAQEAPTA